MSRGCESREGCYNLTNMTCWGCSQPVCPKHSAIRPWRSYRVGSGWKERKHRICDDCIEERAEEQVG